MPSHAVNDFVPRPPVAFENACVYRGFSTGGLGWRPPFDLLYTSRHPSLAGFNWQSSLHLHQEFMEQKDIAEIIMACFRKPKEDEVVKTMNSTEMLKIIQREYPSVPSTHGTKVSIGTGVQTGGLWEVYGRSPAKTSRAETPINTRFFKENGRSDGFFSLHLIYQDSVGPDFFDFGTLGLSLD